jgi:DNA repair exonuclease SbcCD ATPase subunit
MHPLNVAVVNAIQELEAEKEASDSASNERLARLEERIRYEESALRTELADVKIRMAEVLERLNALEAQIGVVSSP